MRCPANTMEYVFWQTEIARRFARGERPQKCLDCGRRKFPRWRRDARGHRFRKTTRPTP